MTTLKELFAKLQTIPILKTVLEAYYKKVFATTGYGMFRGVYRDFQEAERAAPRTKKLGFNHEEFVTHYQDRLQRIFPEDYPALFWLRPILGPGCKVFDFGGHRGIHYYTYAKFVEFSCDLSWMVCELPVIVEAGKKLAKERNAAERLHFTTDFRDADGATIFLASGSLQYVDGPTLSEALGGLECLPKHLILNKLPLYAGKPYVTLQNGRIAFHPLHVYNHDDFIASLDQLGYQLIDEWSVPTRPGRIPFHPEESFSTHTGMYLRLRETAQ